MRNRYQLQKDSKERLCNNNSNLLNQVVEAQSHLQIKHQKGELLKLEVSILKWNKYHRNS